MVLHIKRNPNHSLDKKSYDRVLETGCRCCKIKLKYCGWWFIATIQSLYQSDVSFQFCSSCIHKIRKTLREDHQGWTIFDD